MTLAIISDPSRKTDAIFPAYHTVRGGSVPSLRDVPVRRIPASSIRDCMPPKLMSQLRFACCRIAPSTIRA